MIKGTAFFCYLLGINQKILRKWGLMKRRPGPFLVAPTWKASFVSWLTKILLIWLKTSSRICLSSDTFSKRTGTFNSDPIPEIYLYILFLLTKFILLVIKLAFPPSEELILLFRKTMVWNLKWGSCKRNTQFN